MDKRLKLLKETWNALEEIQDLEEMSVHGDKSGTNVIAYQGNIWLFPDDIKGSDFNKVVMTLDLDVDNIEPEEEFNFDELHSVIQDKDRADILVGWIRYGNLYINNIGGFMLDPKSSLLVKKVVNALKLKNAIFDDGETSVKVPKKKMTAQIPDFAYHGTSLKYLPGILKRGLEPRARQSNYSKQGIYHDDKIFFATRFNEASHHGVTAAHNTKSKSVVIEFRIPDKNAVIADYDVDMGGGATTYDQPEKKSHTKYGSDKSLSLSKEFGVYGYAGKILPQHIKYVFIATKDEVYSLADYKRFTMKQIYKLIDTYGDLSDIF